MRAAASPAAAAVTPNATSGESPLTYRAAAQWATKTRVPRQCRKRDLEHVLLSAGAATRRSQVADRRNGDLFACFAAKSAIKPRARHPRRQARVLPAARRATYRWGISRCGAMGNLIAWAAGGESPLPDRVVVSIATQLRVPRQWFQLNNGRDLPAARRGGRRSSGAGGSRRSPSFSFGREGR